MAEIIYVHKPTINGQDGEPSPTSNLKHAQKLGWQRCNDQGSAKAIFEAKQAAAAAASGNPAAKEADAPKTNPKPKTAGVTDTTNHATAGGAFACPFDDKHGPFRSLRGVDAHLASKHPGQTPPSLPTTE